MMPVLLEQKRSWVQNNCTFESRINAKTPINNSRNSNFRQAFMRHCLQGSMVGMTSLAQGPGNFHSKYCSCVCRVYRDSFQDKASLYLSGRYQLGRKFTYLCDWHTFKMSARYKSFETGRHKSVLLKISGDSSFDRKNECNVIISKL